MVQPRGQPMSFCGIPRYPSSEKALIAGRRKPESAVATTELRGGHEVMATFTNGPRAFYNGAHSQGVGEGVPRGTPPKTVSGISDAGSEGIRALKMY
jgi:hypothetical protein